MPARRSFFFSWNGFFGHETIGTGKIVFYFFLFDFLCVVNLFFLTQNVDHRLSKSMQSGRMHFTRWRTRIAFFFFCSLKFFLSYSRYSAEMKEKITVSSLWLRSLMDLENRCFVEWTISSLGSFGPYKSVIFRNS